MKRKRKIRGDKNKINRAGENEKDERNRYTEKDMRRGKKFRNVLHCTIF